MDRIQAEMSTAIALDVIKATSSLKGLGDAVNSVKNAWQAQEAAAKSSGDYLRAAEERYKGLGSQMDAQKNKIDELKQRQQGLDVSTRDGAESFLKYEKNIQQATRQLASLEAQQERAKSSLEYQKSGLAQLQNEYKQTNAVSDSYVARLKAENKERQANIVQANTLKASLSNLSQQYVKQSEELKRIELESGTMSDAYRKQNIRINETATNISKMKDEFKAAQREVNAANPYGFGTLSSGANGAYRAVSKMGDGLHYATQKAKEFAAAGSLVAIGLGVVATKGIQAASDLENSYIKTLNLAVTGGEKAAEAQRNVNQMQKDGAKLSVQYGKSQFDIAEGYQELIKRGYSTTSALGSMRSELEASVASGDDFNNVLSVTSQVVDAYGLRVDDAAKMVKNTKDVTNQLAYAADMTATDFQSMGKSMEYVADTAHSAGIELSTTSSAVGILSNHGLEADKAGTGLRKVINSLTGAMADQQEAMAGNAESADKLNEKIGEQTKKVQEAQDKLNKASEAEKSNTGNKKNATKATEAAAKALEKQQAALDKLDGKAQGIQANDMLSKLGISRDQLINSNGQLKSMSEIMKVINDHTKGIKDDDTRNNVFHALFGTTGMQAGIILAQNNAELDELNKKVRNAADGEGYVHNLAQKNMDTTKAKLAQLKSSADLIVNSIGASLLPSVSEFAVKLANALNSEKGQEQLKQLAKVAGDVGRSIVSTIEFVWKHRSELVIIGETLAGIWAFKKITDAVSWVRTAIGTYRELNEVLKTTNALNSVGIFYGKGNIASAGTSAASGLLKTGGTSAMEIGSASSSLVPLLSRFLPYVGVLTGLGQAGYSAYNATKATNDLTKRTDQGGGIGGLSGTVIGAGIGSLIAPGIGTALGAALGGTIGTDVGKKFGRAYQEGFKESHPKSISAWLGDDWDAAYKESSSETMKRFSSSYKAQIDELNNTVKLKIDVDDKGASQNKKKVETIYASLQKTIDDFYKHQEQDSKKNLDILVKNGIITQKQEDDLLKKSQANDEKAKKSKQDLADQLKKTSENYYADVAKIQSGGTKKLEEIEKKYGSNSKKYKTEQTKELESLQNKYSKDMVGIENKLNTSVSKATQVAATKQEDILESLRNTKKTIGLKQIVEDEKEAKKNHDTIVNWATKTRDDVVNTANKKYKDSVSAADKEYYQNKTISKKQYDEVVKNARKQRDDTIDAAETQRKQTTKSANDQYGEILDRTEKQRYNVTHKSKLQKDGVVGHLQDQKDTTTRLGREQSNTISDWADKQKNNTTKSAKDQRDGVSDAFGTMWQWLKTGAEWGINGLFTPINIGIGAINGLISAFGGSKKTIEPLAVKFATGTGYFSSVRRPITEPTLAMLNDGHDSPETGNREMLIHPNGKSEVVQGTNVIRPLLPGTEVLNARETAMLLSGNMPRFAEGTGFLSKLFGGVQSAGSWVGNAIGNIWDGMKNGADKFMKMFGYITDSAMHPIESLEKKFNPTRKSDLGSVMNNIGDNVFYDQTKKQAKEWWSELWGMAKGAAETGDTGGQGDNYPWRGVGKDSGVDPWGYFFRECVSYVANSLKNMGVSSSLFTGLGNGSDWVNAPVRHTNTPKPGMVAVYGPGSEFGNHVAMVRGVKGSTFSGEEYNWGGDGKYHTYSGRSKSGVTTFLDFGKSGGDENGVQASSPLQKLIKSQTGGMFDWIQKFIGPINDTSTGVGGSVQSWSNDVKKALSKLGLSTSSDMIQKVLRQIQTESSGNPSAIGGNDGLDDGNATGLMQVKPGTFRAYALPGHNNIMNGYDNMLAGLNYAKNRYGSDLSFLGNGHGYANGVITNHPHLANIAEGGMTEAIIPWDLSKKSRAMELLGETVTHFAQNTEVMPGGDAKNSDISELSKILNKTNDIVSQIASAVFAILGETQESNKPLDAISMNSLSRSVINRAVRSAN
ncbi:phage tail tape measure protein [Leuconostoc holzapfelii]|uniref:Phage tail tape measure protein n=1 Tax=Leuconostoc holzapfelii TaxID=434464 RepID=A0ABT2NW42_9LACO|nr:phage tail tape measure protein [Leuconostoc holzapfelii]MCT8389585.1 phage tail tape measure protein [Leuconostoc holzapfelii]